MIRRFLLLRNVSRPWALDSQVKKSGLGLQGGTVTLEIANERVFLDRAFKRDLMKRVNLMESAPPELPPFHCPS